MCATTRADTSGVAGVAGHASCKSVGIFYMRYKKKMEGTDCEFEERLLLRLRKEAPPPVQWRNKLLLFVAASALVFMACGPSTLTKFRPPNRNPRWPWA